MKCSKQGSGCSESHYLDGIFVLLFDALVKTVDQLQLAVQGTDMWFSADIGVLYQITDIAYQQKQSAIIKKVVDIIHFINALKS